MELMMKRALSRPLALGLGLAAVLAAGPPAAAEMKLRASGSFPAGHTGSIAMEVFKSELARRTGGAVVVELFPGNVLGGAFEQVDQIRTGQIQMAWAGPSFYDRLVPEFNAATLPFAASTAQQAFCMIDSDLGTYLAERSAEKGVMVLGWGSNGFRHITNNKRPIKKVEDLKGLKIRTPSGEIFSMTFRAVGANPTPIDIKELYQALQQGVVDGQENPYDNMWVRKFHEVQKHISNSGHFYDWVTYFVHKPTFDGLKPEHQKAIRESMFVAVSYQRALAERENAEALGKLIKGGMKYDELSREELGKFREAVRPVWERIRERIGNKAVDLAVKAIKECS